MPVTIFFRSPIPFRSVGLSEGLGGAETAAFRMAAALRHLGIDTELVDNTVDRCGHNDVVVIVRFPVDVLRLRHRFRRVYFWPADDVTHPTFGPLSSPAFLDCFNEAVDGVLAISGYQQMRLLELGIHPGKLIPTRYGIDVTLFPPRVQRPNPVCIYTSSPRRGLHILKDIWPAIVNAVPEGRLQVFSSMRTYHKDDAPFTGLYNELRGLKGVAVYGSVPQRELADRLNRARVFLYPNIFPETASIATLEARAAGCLIITTYSGALRETAAGNLFVPPPESSGFHSALITQTIRGLTDDSLYHTISRNNQAGNSQYDWSTIAHEWIEQLELT